MKLRALAPTPAAVREVLERRGVPADRAAAAATGLAPVRLVLDGLPPPVEEELARAARADGLACLSGDGWLLLAGDAARLAGLGRPERGVVPAELLAAFGAALHGVLDPPTVWETGRGALSLDRPVVLGIVNVTPDSFSDGGRYLDPDAALRHAERLLADGADVLDLGAESTRPGRPAPVAADEEWRRLAPVLDALARRFPAAPLSVDTVKADTARRALEAGGWIVNDVSGLRHDPRLAEVCAVGCAGLVLMHSRGPLTAMATYEHAAYTDVVDEVRDELAGSLRAAEAGGVPAARIVVDPGLGFAKRPEHNLEVLDRLAELAVLGRPILVGPSRKRFLGAVTGRPPEERDAATAAACVTAYERGARLFRVHDVAGTREALDLAHAIRAADPRPTGPPARQAGRGRDG